MSPSQLAMRQIAVPSWLATVAATAFMATIPAYAVLKQDVAVLNANVDRLVRASDVLHEHIADPNYHASLEARVNGIERTIDRIMTNTPDH